MSQASAARHSVAVANKNSGGARSTRSARTRHGNDFLKFCRSRGTPLTNIEGATGEMVSAYVNFLMSASGPDKNGKRTLENKVASIRVLMKERGVNLEERGIPTNAQLGISGASRAGKKQPIDDERFEAACAIALSKKQLGMYHALRLERYLGVRGLEAIMSTNALARVAREARSMAEGRLTAVHIFDGTKGGRPRTTAVILKHAQLTLEVIRDALKFARDNGGYLIKGPKPGLKSARSKYHRLAREIGLTGEYAPHSCRYRYAVDKLQELFDLSVPGREARGLVAAWLGHGDSRGRWVAMVYAKSISATAPRSTIHKDQAAVLATVETFLNKIGESPS